MRTPKATRDKQPKDRYELPAQRDTRPSGRTVESAPARQANPASNPAREIKRPQNTYLNRPSDEGIHSVQQGVSAAYDVSAMPQHLEGTFDAIVQQLDMLTRTMALMEERQSASEDKLRLIEDNQKWMMQELQRLGSRWPN
eukprot:TRINITY_DN4045_c0_g1_i4.p1 TRINITY_DN4045_c0_g1~~TRINITY_DN4045_c0_g1_i4.p1  ORF type:complete len:141 (+),score=21.22 TRINITY_DN4045_c0_g1_i4:138-560(+)